MAPFAPEGEIGNWQGIEIALYSGWFRETALVPVLEQSAVEFIFSLGLVGSLSDDLQPGDLVMPIASVRGDGLTDHWAETRLRAVANVTALLALHQAAGRSGIKITSSIFHTTATMQKEIAFLPKWAKQGVIGVQMEIAQHFILAHLYRKKAAGVYVASDFPLKGDQIWRTGVYLTPELSTAYERWVDILLGAIQLLTGLAHA